MRVIKDNRNPMGTNSYLVIDDNTKECYIIDCASKLEAFQNIIEEENLELNYILLTHGHFDHVMGAEFLRDKYNAKIVAHVDEKSILNNENLNLSSMIRAKIEFDADIYLEGEEGVFEIFKYIHTPGHTKGGVSFLIEDRIFTGDTLFDKSIGRTDFPTGNYKTLIDVIKQKILVLDPDTIVHAGHNDDTTVGAEKMHNPFLI